MTGRQESTCDVLGLGCVAVDDLLTVAAYPPADAKVPVRQRTRSCGGLTATSLVAAARLGAHAAYAGSLGDDDDSAFVLACFQREGIDVRHLVHISGVRPVRSVIIVDETAQTRTIFYDLTGARGADPDLPADEAIRSARVLLVDHFGIEGMTRAARIAREAGRPVVADFERCDWPGFDGLLALVDHPIVSQGFATRWTGVGDPAVAVARMAQADRAAAVVTCGAGGCWTWEAGAVRHWPAFAIQAVDTTGCGDVFHGAYAAALARGCDLAARIRLASAAAALKATRRGGHAAIPTLSEVEAFLNCPG